MGYSSSLLDGLAQLLDGAGLGVYRPAGIYAEGERAIGFGRLPAAPDEVLWLTTYPVEDTDLPDVITGVQIRMRGGEDPLALEDLADDVRDLLHNRRHEVIGGVRVELMWRQSQAPMGQDEHGREELAANYYVRAQRPGPHLYE